MVLWLISKFDRMRDASDCFSVNYFTEERILFATTSARKIEPGAFSGASFANQSKISKTHKRTASAVPATDRMRCLLMQKPDRKPAKDQTLVYLHILGKLTTSGWKTCDSVWRSLLDDGLEGVSKQMVQRALRALRAEPAFDIELDDQSIPYGYRLGRNSPFARLELSPQEALLLSLARAHLRFQMPSKCLESLEKFFDQARQQIKGPKLARARDWENKVAIVPNQLPFKRIDIANAILKPVTDALYSDKVLRLEYEAAESTGRSRGRPIEVEPLGLVQQDGRIYLVCRYVPDGAFRHLALHRIKRAAVTDLSFVPPADFSLERYIDGQHFNYSRSGARVRLSFETTKAATARNLEETPFNDTQKVEAIAPGRWRISAVLPDSRLIDGWLAMWTSDSSIENVVRERLDEQT